MSVDFLVTQIIALAFSAFVCGVIVGWVTVTLLYGAVALISEARNVKPK